MTASSNEKEQHMNKALKTLGLTIAAVAVAIPTFMIFAIIGGPVGVAVAAIFAVAFAGIEIMDWID